MLYFLYGKGNYARMKKLLLIVYTLLLFAFIPLSLYYLLTNFSWGLLALQIAGLIAIGHRFAHELSKHHLPLYFWIERQKLRFSETMAKWWFHARFDGIESKEVFDRIETELKKYSRFKIKLTRQTEREKFFTIDDTTFLKITYSDGDDFHTPVSEEAHIDVVSEVMEIPYARSKEKLEKQIEPLLIILKDITQPTNQSFELNVEFLKKPNPFFNVYVANLSPSDIEDFRVVLHVDGNSTSGLKDKVVILSDKLRITAESTNSFTKLAKDFIVLTPDTRLLIGDKDA